MSWTRQKKIESALSYNDDKPPDKRRRVPYVQKRQRPALAVSVAEHGAWPGMPGNGPVAPPMPNGFPDAMLKDALPANRTY